MPGRAAVEWGTVMKVFGWLRGRSDADRGNGAFPGTTPALAAVVRTAISEEAARALAEKRDRERLHDERVRERFRHLTSGGTAAAVAGAPCPPAEIAAPPPAVAKWVPWRSRAAKPVTAPGAIAAGGAVPREWVDRLRAMLAADAQPAPAASPPAAGRPPGAAGAPRGGTGPDARGRDEIDLDLYFYR